MVFSYNPQMDWMLARARAVPVTVEGDYSGTTIEKRQLPATFLAHEERIRKSNATISREQVEWMAELATYRQYWTDVEEIILLHSASTSATVAQITTSGDIAVQPEYTGPVASAPAFTRSVTPAKSEPLAIAPQVADPKIQADVFLSSIGRKLEDTSLQWTSGRTKNDRGQVEMITKGEKEPPTVSQGLERSLHRPSGPGSMPNNLPFNVVRFRREDAYPKLCGPGMEFFRKFAGHFPKLRIELDRPFKPANTPVYITVKFKYGMNARDPEHRRIQEAVINGLRRYADSYKLKIGNLEYITWYYTDHEDTFHTEVARRIHISQRNASSGRSEIAENANGNGKFETIKRGVSRMDGGSAMKHMKRNRSGSSPTSGDWENNKRRKAGAEYSGSRTKSANMKEVVDGDQGGTKLGTHRLSSRGRSPTGYQKKDDVDDYRRQSNRGQNGSGSRLGTPSYGRDDVHPGKSLARR